MESLDSETPTAADDATTLDDGELTETASRLRRTSGQDLYADAARRRDDARPTTDETDIPDDMPLA